MFRQQFLSDYGTDSDFSFLAVYSIHKVKCVRPIKEREVQCRIHVYGTETTGTCTYQFLFKVRHYYTYITGTCVNNTSTCTLQTCMCYSCMVTRYSQDCDKVVTSIQLCCDSLVTIYWTDYQSTVHIHKSILV